MDLPAPIEGRDGKGRFAPGNKASKGNPHAQRVHRLRSVLIRATTPARMAKVIDTLLSLAEAGDVQAAKLVLAYTLGPPPQQLAVTADVRSAPFAEVCIVELPQKIILPANGREAHRSIDAK